jgi:hypothetical protein
MMADVTVDQVIAQARTYSGCRWRHQGRVRAGMDCLGLMICTAHDLGLTEFDTTDYGLHPNGDLTKGLREHCIEQPPGTPPAPGLLAEMTFEQEPQHVALIVPYHAGGLGVLHALSLFPRKVVEHSLDRAWRRRIVRFYRLPGVVYP